MQGRLRVLEEQLISMRGSLSRQVRVLISFTLVLLLVDVVRDV